MANAKRIYPPYEAAGGVIETVQTYTTSFTLTTGDGVGTALCYATAASIVATLPLAANVPYRKITYKKMDTTVHTITPTASGSDIVELAVGLNLSLYREAITLQSDGTAAWMAI